MPLNSTDFNQIFNKAPSWHVQTIQNIIKDATTPSRISLFFEGVLDAFRLIRCQPNFKQSSIRACGHHPKCHQGLQPRSGTTKSSSTPVKNPQMSSIFQVVLDAFKLI